MEGEIARASVRGGSRLERVLAAKRFAVTAEISPPPSPDPTDVVEAARTMRGFADAFNVTDCLRANVRMASWAAAAILLKEGLEPVMQMATRDRNRVALQADALGAAAIGVRNILCLRGDDPASGNEPEAPPVFDLETEDLLEALRGLRDEGRLHGGDPIDGRPELFLGATANPLGGDIEASFVNLRGKAEAGADFIQTQAVYDLDAFGEWMHLVRKEWLHEKMHILAGIIPLKGAKMGRFLNENVPGVSVPADVIARVERAADPRAEGIRIAVEAIDRLREIEGVRGVHLMAVGWDEAIPAIVKAAGLYPRPGD